MSRFALLLLLGAFAQTAEGREPISLKARVVWWQGDRIYLSVQDSLDLQVGTVLAFKDRQKTVATGEVLTVFDDNFVVAKLSSGSFGKVKRPERLLVQAEPQELRLPKKFRLGFPSSSRANILFACDKLETDPHAAGSSAIRLSEHLYQLVNRPEIPDTASWPDTLLLRFFDDTADQEIALERGELDAAVFWPGEASLHIRDELKWAGEPAGLRSRGFLAALFLVRHPSVDSLAAAIVTRDVMRKVNVELFRGDLGPCDPAVVDTLSNQIPPMRFDVDDALPDDDRIQRILDREWKSNTLAKASNWVRISYVDQPPDSLAIAIRVSGTAKPVPPADVMCVYRIRCPILCRPEMRRYVEAMGPDRIVNLLRCRMRPSTP